MWFGRREQGNLSSRLLHLLVGPTGWYVQYMSAGLCGCIVNSPLEVRRFCRRNQVVANGIHAAVSANAARKYACHCGAQAVAAGSAGATSFNGLYNNAYNHAPGMPSSCNGPFRMVFCPYSMLSLWRRRLAYAPTSCYSNSIGAGGWGYKPAIRVTSLGPPENGCPVNAASRLLA